ncbi:MAG: hypothetical protein GY896_02325 [Gammaproteobacteria bacterium]|nr:hypothetical protein [Gammaproteobacteria bacterium]
MGISDCATNTESVSQIIEFDAMAVFLENPLGSEISFEAGETVMVYTKSKVNISSWHVGMVKMVVTDVNTTRITGGSRFRLLRLRNRKEEVVGEIVEVDIDNIAKIYVVEDQVPAVGNKTAGEKVGEFTAQLAFVPVDAALTAIIFVISIGLLQFIL